MLGLVFSGATRTRRAEEPYKAQIDALRNAMEKYKDYKVAVRDLYFSTVGCVITPARKWPVTCTTPRAPWACTSSI